jgi:hypothetical protein
MHAQRDCFLETFTKLISQQKYEWFIGTVGLIDDLPDEIRDVGIKHAIPFINTGCKLPCCVYDISTLHELYIAEYDVQDEFKEDLQINCFYCEQKIFYKDFFTCETMVQDVEKLFGRRSTRRGLNSWNGTILRSSERNNSSNDNSLSLMKRSLPKIELGGEVLKQGIRLMKVEEPPEPVGRVVKADPITPVSKRAGSKLISKFEPCIEEMEEEEAFPINLSPIPKRLRSANRRSTLLFDNSVVLGMLPKRKKSVRLSNLLDWREFKLMLAEIPFPEFEQYDSNELVQLESILTSKAGLCANVDPKVANWLYAVPTVGEILAFKNSGEMSQNIFRLICLYLRSKQSSRQQKLGLFWHFIVDDSQRFIPEKSMIEKNTILHNQDFSQILIVISSEKGSNVYLVEKSTLDVTLLNFKHQEDGQNPDTSLELELVSRTEETKSGAIFSDLKKLYSEYFKESLDGYRFGHLVIPNRHRGLSATVDFIGKLSGLEDYIHAASQKRLNEKLLWVLLKIVNLSIKKAIVKIAQPIQYIKKSKLNKELPKQLPVHKSANSMGSASIVVATEETREEIHSRRQRNLPVLLSRAGSPKEVIQPKMDQKYQEIKNLLSFYQQHDKVRHETLLKKCEATYAPQILESLTRRSSRNILQPDQRSLNPLSLISRIKTNACSTKASYRDHQHLKNVKKSANSPSSTVGTPTHFISSPYLAPYVNRTKDSNTYAIRYADSVVLDSELPDIKQGDGSLLRPKSLNHLEISSRIKNKYTGLDQPNQVELTSSYRRLNLFGKTEAVPNIRSKNLVSQKNSPNSPNMKAEFRDSKTTREGVSRIP